MNNYRRSPLTEETLRQKNVARGSGEMMAQEASNRSTYIQGTRKESEAGVRVHSGLFCPVLLLLLPVLGVVKLHVFFLEFHLFVFGFQKSDSVICEQFFL
jgi:hypothetical protein